MSFIYNMADTWNAAGTTFTAIKMNVTNTASAAGSLLMDLQIGGVSKLSVSKTSIATVSAASPDLAWIIAACDGSVALVDAASYNAAASGPLIRNRKFRGSLASPAVIASGDTCGSFNCNGYDGAAERAVGSYVVKCIAATPSGTDMQGQVIISVPPSGGVAGQAIQTMDHTNGVIFAPVAGGVTVPGGATMLKLTTAATNGAGASAGTLTNAPAVGNPTKWIAINDAGVTRYIPAW